MPSCFDPVTPLTMHHSSLLLFLLGLRLLSLGLSSLLPNTNKTGIRPCNTQLAVSILLALNVLELGLRNDRLIDNGQCETNLRVHVLAGSGLLDILGRSVTLLVLANPAWEEDEAFLIFLEALHVGCEGLFGDVLAARINGDADG
jgi:hypothetical protein